MRILLLKSLLLCTNCPSFLPILCGILFVFAVDLFLFLPWICFCRRFVFAVDLFLIWFWRFLFLPWNPFCFCRGFVLPWIPFCFCRGYLFVFAVDAFVYIPSFFLFLSFLLSRSFYYLPRNPKNVGDLLEKVHRFSEKVYRFFENLHRFLEATL